MGYLRDQLLTQQESYIKDIYLIILQPLQDRPDSLANLVSEVGGDGVADLVVLLGPVTHEEVVVREGLDPSGLTDGEAPGLPGVVLNIVMSVL